MPPLKSRMNNIPQSVINLVNTLKSGTDFSKNLREILSQTNYSYVHMSRLFKKYMNTTLSKYYFTIKMNEALWQLEDPEKRITEIAQNIGYSSLGHFNTVFKEHFNITPSKYRKNYNICLKQGFEIL